MGTLSGLEGSLGDPFGPSKAPLGTPSAPFLGGRGHLGAFLSHVGSIFGAVSPEKLDKRDTNYSIPLSGHIFQKFHIFSENVGALVLGDFRCYE